MASNAAVPILEAKNLAAAGTYTVAGQRVNYADYLTEYQGDSPCTYAQYIAVAEHIQRNAFAT